MHDIHLFHFLTSLSYAVVGGVFFACGASVKFRFSLLRSEAERAFTFMATGVFVYACFLDHMADSLGADDTTLWVTAFFEMVVSVLTAGFLVVKAAVRWNK